MNDKDRIAALEKQLNILGSEKAEALEALERAANLGRFDVSYGRLESRQPIVKDAMGRICDILHPDSAIIYLIEEDTDDFMAALAEPPSRAGALEREVDGLIADQSFALALNTLAPSFFLASDRESRLLLHPLATPSRVRGMFAAMLAGDAEDTSDITLSMLTVVLNACAMALESYELYRHFLEANRDLEQMVQDRTLEISKANAQMRAMLDASYDAVILIDSDDRIRFWSPQAESMFGYAEEEVLDRRLHDIVTAREEDLAAAHKGLELFTMTGYGPVLGMAMEFPARRRDGTIFPVERSAAALQIDGKWHAMGIVRDITVRKQAEEELLRLNKELAERKAELEADLHLAAEVQQRLLPDRTLRVPGLDVDWRFKPSATIGGDIFNLVVLPDKTVSAYVLDVSGHGAPAALVTASVARTLDPQSGVLADNGRAVSPEEVVRRLEEEYPIERFEKFFSLICLSLNRQEGTLEYANAGHPQPLLSRSRGGVEILQEGGTVIGMGGMVPVKAETVVLEPGDTLLLYTDACLEHEEPDGEAFGMERLCSILERTSGGAVDEILDAVYSELMDFGQGRALEDDITLLCIRYLGPEGDRNGHQT